METRILIVILALWFLFMVIAIINAITREAVYRPVVGELAAHQVSTLIFVALILSVTYLTFRSLDVRLKASDALLTGSIWLVMTVAFEFIAGHYIFGNPWEKLLADYNILKGRVWSLVLLTTFVAPYITSRLV